MSVLISKLGNVGVQLGVLVSGNPTGTVPYVVDWTAPQPNQFWIVDSASIQWQSAAGGATPDQNLSGFYCAPAGAPIVNDPPHIGNGVGGPFPADFTDRGTALLTETVPFQASVITTLNLFTLILARPVIIPFGSKLRVVLTQVDGGYAFADLPFYASATIRTFTYDMCDPVPTC